mgnify:FL=1
MTDFSFPDIFYRHPNALPAQRKAGVLQTFARIFRHSDVTFSFSESPKTDGKTVWLGAINPADEAFEALALGHGIHEMMHVTETDMTILQDASMTPFISSLLNALEDIRIDRLGMEHTATYAVWRGAMAEVLEARNQLAGQHTAGLTPAELISLWLHLELTAELPMPWADRLLPEVRKRVDEKLPRPLTREALQLARDVCRAASTRDAARIARDIADLLEKSQSNEAPPHEAASAPTLTPEEAAFLQSALRQTGAATSDMGLAYFIDAGRQPARASDSDSLQIPGRLGADKPHYRAAPWPNADALTETIAKEDAPLFRERFESAADGCRRLKGAFTRAFIGHRDDEDDNTSRGFALASDAALRLQIGNPRLFSSPAARKTVCGDLVVLLDRSGSMGVTRMTSAKIAVTALWQALAKLPGITKRLAVFPGHGETDVGVLFRTGESLESFTDRFKSVNAFGSTPINEALFWAVDQITAADNETQNRLILVITDGDFPITLSPLLKERLEASGAEIAVLSIAARVENRDVPQVVVNRDADIAPGLVRLIERTRFCRRIRS